MIYSFIQITSCVPGEQKLEVEDSGVYQLTLMGTYDIRGGQSLIRASEYQGLALDSAWCMARWLQSR